MLPATQDGGALLEQVVIQGDLAKLSATDRVAYYKRVCESLGLNPYTKPFDYITLNNRLTLYARKDATDQLRRQQKISIAKPDIRFEGDDWIIVTVEASNADGRTDSDVGVVSRKDMRGDFGNALMKAVTKAKRRVTLSICGLGMLDETEVETIPDAKPGPPVILDLPAKIAVTRQTVEKAIEDIFPEPLIPLTENDLAGELRADLEEMVRNKAPKGQEDAKWASAKNWMKQNRGVEFETASVDSLQAIYDELKGKR